MQHVFRFFRSKERGLNVVGFFSLLLLENELGFAVFEMLARCLQFCTRASVWVCNHVRQTIDLLFPQSSMNWRDLGLRV